MAGVVSAKRLGVVKEEEVSRLGERARFCRALWLLLEFVRTVLTSATNRLKLDSDRGGLA